MIYDLGIAQDVGRQRRKTNPEIQDYADYHSVNPESRILDLVWARQSYLAVGLADGHGSKGDEASKIAVDTSIRKIKKELRFKPDGFIAENDISELVKDAIEESESAVTSNDSYNRTGTTLDLAVLDFNGNYTIGHVGDGRVYKVSRNNIERITEDQVEYLVDDWPEKPTESMELAHQWHRTSPSALGKMGNINVLTYKGSIKPGESLLMVTDGVHSSVTEGEMHREILRKDHSEERIINRASSPFNAVTKAAKIRKDYTRDEIYRRMAGADNATVVLIRSEET